MLIGGLLTSTLLTLVFVPAMYSIFDDLQELVLRLVRRRPPARRSSGPVGRPSEVAPSPSPEPALSGR